MKTALKWTGITLLAAAACSAVFGRKCLFRKRGCDAEKSSVRDADTLDLIAQGIKLRAEDFNGLYEGLYQAAQRCTGLSTDAYEEWCDRVQQTDDPDFRRAFFSRFSKTDTENESLCREKFALLLSCIDTAGIARERESMTVYTADAAMQRAYFSADGEKLRIGAGYTVIKSAWLCGDKVIECGMAVPGTISL